MAELSQNILLDVTCLVLQNARDVYQPYINVVNQNMDPQIEPLEARRGVWLDPFVSLIAHSCEGNCYFVFEGPELRVRALTDIQPGVELTESRLGRLEINGETRRDRLRSYYNIACGCRLCISPSSEPKGALREQLEKYENNLLPMSDKKFFATLLRDIAAFEAAGFGYNTVPCRSLYRHLMKWSLVQRKTADSLKATFKNYYLIEPAQKSRFPPAHHLNSLFHILTSLQAKLSFVTPMEPLPRRVGVLVPDIWNHLRYQLVVDTAKIFGEDSTIAKLERAMFAEIQGELLAWSRKDGIYPEGAAYIPLSESKEQKEKFLVAMKKLLKWAGIEGVGDEELL